MGYQSDGRKPFEMASKASHHHIINDPIVKKTMALLDFPPDTDKIDLKGKTVPFSPDHCSPITNIIAVDGGYTKTEIRKGFPSSLLHFFQFGALCFKREDLKNLDRIAHISPEDMAVLNNIHRLKLALPTQGFRRRDTNSLLDTVRLSYTIYTTPNCQTLISNF